MEVLPLERGGAQQEWRALLERRLPLIKGFADMTVTYVLSREWQDLFSIYLFRLHPLPHCSDEVGYSFLGFVVGGTPSGSSCSPEAPASSQAQFALVLLLAASVAQGIAVTLMTRSHYIAEQVASISGMCVGWGAGDALIRFWLEQVDLAQPVVTPKPRPTPTVSAAPAGAPAPVIVDVPSPEAATPRLLAAAEAYEGPLASLLVEDVHMAGVVFALGWSIIAALLIILLQPLVRNKLSFGEGFVPDALEECAFALWSLSTRALTTSVMMLWAYVSKTNLESGLLPEQKGGELHWRLLLLWALCLTFAGAFATVYLLRWRQALDDTEEERSSSPVSNSSPVSERSPSSSPTGVDELPSSGVPSDALPRQQADPPPTRSVTVHSPRADQSEDSHRSKSLGPKRHVSSAPADQPVLEGKPTAAAPERSQYQRLQDEDDEIYTDEQHDDNGRPLDSAAALFREQPTKACVPHGCATSEPPASTINQEALRSDAPPPRSKWLPWRSSARIVRSMHTAQDKVWSDAYMSGAMYPTASASPRSPPPALDRGSKPAEHLRDSSLAERAQLVLSHACPASAGEAWRQALRAAGVQVLLLMEKVLAWLAGCSWTDVFFAAAAKPSVWLTFKDLLLAFGLTAIALVWIFLAGRTLQIHGNVDRHTVESYFMVNSASFFVGWSWVVVLRDLSAVFGQSEFRAQGAAGALAQVFGLETAATVRAAEEGAFLKALGGMIIFGPVLTGMPRHDANTRGTSRDRRWGLDLVLSPTCPHTLAHSDLCPLAGQ